MLEYSKPNIGMRESICMEMKTLIFRKRAVQNIKKQGTANLGHFVQQFS